MIGKRMRYRIKCLKGILPFNDKSVAYFALSICINSVLLLIKMYKPQIYKHYINQVVMGGQIEKIIGVVIAYLSFFIVKSAIDYIKFFVKTKYSNDLQLKLKSHILRNLFTAKYISYDTLDVGEVKMKIEDDVKYIMTFVDTQSVDYLFSILSLIISSIFLFKVDWHIAIFSLISIPITVFVDDWLSKREKVLTTANRLNEKKMIGWLNDSLKGWREVKALELADYQEKKYDNFLRNYAKYYSERINYWTARVLVIPKIKDTFFMQLSLYFLGGWLIMHGKITIGDLLVASIYYETMSAAINGMSTRDAELQANMTHTDKILNEIRPITQEREVVPFHSICKRIECKNVGFKYPSSDKTILNNVNMEINSGDRIAIVGQSGCGKSTLLKIIAGMVDPLYGQVLVNGENILMYDIDSYQKHIGFVMQENILFNCSIRDNLLYGKDDATMDELTEACRKANILNYINGLPQGFNTIVGERGIKLSGGQRQRLILARLLLKSPDIYILDEATGNIDSSNERRIYEEICNTVREKIIIIVTHRVSAVSFCNKIFDLERNIMINNS